jgi:hypothetical protein
VNDIRKVIEFYAHTRHEYKLLEQLDQLEADAELGRAVRYLASNHISVPMQYMSDYITDETIEYIVKTAKKVVENC